MGYRIGTRMSRRNGQVHFQMNLFLGKLAKCPIEKSFELGKQLDEIVMLLWCEVSTLSCNLFRCYLVVFTFQNIRKTILENIGLSIVRRFVILS